MNRLILALVVTISACGPIESSEGSAQQTAAPPVLWYEAAVAQPPEGAVPVESGPEISDSPFLEVAFAGDTSFTHGLSSRDPLGGVASLLQVPDLTMVNLESALAEAAVGDAQLKEFTFRSPPEAVALLREAGVDGVALANNHALDYGRPALSRTLELLDEGGVGRAGAGANSAEAFAPMLFVRDGTRVAVLSYSRVLPGSWAALEDRSGVASAYDATRTIEAIEQAAQAADVVVVMVHWGVELDGCPQPYQRSLAATWADAGADLIIGSHPHVLQGVEQIGDAWAVYSTGNFVFPSARQQSAETALFRFTFHDDTISLVVDPLRIAGGRPQAADADSAARILAM